MMRPLGIDENLNDWIDLKVNDSALKSPPESNKEVNQTKKCKLYDIQSELNLKLFSILDAIPLEEFPGYDPKVYQKLKIFNRQINARIRQTDRKLISLPDVEPEDNINVKLSSVRNSETRDVINQKLSPPLNKSIHNIQPKRPLSACFGPAITQNSKYVDPKLPSISSTTIAVSSLPITQRYADQKPPSTSTATITVSDSPILENIVEGDELAKLSLEQKSVPAHTKTVDKDELLDIDMQGFLALADDSEEFFSNKQEISDSSEFPEFIVEGPTNQATNKSILQSNSNNSVVQWIGNVNNDGGKAEFNTLDHPHCRKMLNIFRANFGLHLFRPNQLSAINAAILGHDCFILMPTGGGKSLCYQLPALMANGVTVVISPLRSLILDQTQKLLSLDISAMYMTGDQNDAEQNEVYKKIHEQNTDLRLLYVTPEKIASSPKFVDMLNFLYRQKKLVRFVIDEVHCVSQWGHDFRPDYKKLSMLRQRFPKVPLMALTATATQRVRSDILHQLNIQSPKWFISSFNRPNLRYSVLPKKSKAATCNQITQIIKSKFPNDSGIIYCISRNDCDELAEALTINGLKASSYHAGLDDKDRVERQTQWISEKIKIIVATIAFGMGIDKLNVRFVIHGAMPKSIEGYYQESGRAGRDGEPADCILLYSYADVYRYRNMFEKNENSNPEVVKTHMDNLYKMVHFCENVADCRRALQLNYFGEQFDRRDCIENKETSCDNCQAHDQFEELDVTTQAKDLMQLIQYCNNRRQNCVTMLQVVDIYKGSDISAIAYKLGGGYHQWYGKGNDMTKYEIERLLHILVFNDFLCENMVPNNANIMCAYLAFGTKAKDFLLSNDVQICLHKKATKKLATMKPKKFVPLEPQFSAVTNVALKDLEQRCYEELMMNVNGIAGALDVSANSIMNMVALRKMSQELPTTRTAMLKIPHVTKANYEKYGKALLDITKKYSREKDTLLEEEQDIQSAYQDLDFESDDEWVPTTSNNNNNNYNNNYYNNYNYNNNNSYNYNNNNNNRGKRKRGNRGQSKRFKPNNSDGNSISIAGSSNTIQRYARANSSTNSRKRNTRGRGGGNVGIGRGPGLCDLTKKYMLHYLQ